MITKEQYQKALNIVILYDRQIKHDIKHQESQKILVYEYNIDIRKLWEYIKPRGMFALLRLEIKTIGEFKNFDVDKILKLKNVGKTTRTILQELQERIIISDLK